MAHIANALNAMSSSRSPRAAVSLTLTGGTKSTSVRASLRAKISHQRVCVGIDLFVLYARVPHGSRSLPPKLGKNEIIHLKGVKGSIASDSLLEEGVLVLGSSLKSQ